MSEVGHAALWASYRLIDLARYHNGYAFKPKDWSEDGTKIIRIEQLNNPNGTYDYFSGNFPPQNAVCDGDLIFSWSATLRVAIWRHGPAVLNQHLFRVDENELVERLYLFYLLDYHMDALGGGSHGSTMKHIKRSELEKFRVLIPKRPYQRKSAAVLRSLDLAIEKTEALIEKYRKVKAGLMQDLFTRGIGKDGKLRPPHSEAPHLYKQTPIGWLPKEWTVTSISRLVRSAEYGISTSLSDKQNGIAVLRMNNIQAGQFDVNDIKYSTDREAYRLSLRVGDVLYNRTNSMEHVGKCAIWRGELPRSSFASYLVRLNLDDRKVDANFFTYWLNQPSSQIALRAFATPAVQQVNINPTNLQRVLMGYPDEIKEQKEVAEKLSIVDQRAAAEHVALSKLRVQKAGLMHDLLTGKVEVKVEAAETVHV